MSWKSYGVVLGGSTLLSLCCTIQFLWCHWKHPFLLNDGNVLSCTAGIIETVSSSAGTSHRGEYVYEYEEETVSDSAESDHEKKKKARGWKLVKRVDAMRDADMEMFSGVYVSCHFFCLFEQLEFLLLYSHRSVTVPTLWRHWLTGSYTEWLFFLRNSPKLTGAQRQEGWEEDARLGLFDLLCIQSR